ncbi:tetratricopeptide repeat protein [Ruficoccus amylovorans]|uniref:Tetratricopeptide repeat protein n=1 Tax=Ruficoccus amylovorans TaxID=1804625 RepID=A0A842H9W9_9BACT|nr:tetratricopeptide repeat protein [Ruficoccus amylovorans]MBC2593095.1 tetratricopeptide repeat protein [Ruficoccus amylovorans]
MSITVGKIAAICLSVATFFVAGCSRSDPEAERARIDAEVAAQLDTAKAQLYSGNVEQAVRALELLDADHPNRPAVIEQLAFAYLEVPDPAMAAFYFDQAYGLDNTRTDLALFAAQAHSRMKDWNAAATAYQNYLAGEPLDTQAWKELAKAQRAAGKLQPSLDAWLRAFKTSNNKPTCAEAVQLGQLYYELGNQAQAGDWWNYALKMPEQGDGYAQARMGLLRLALTREHWDQAEQLVARLDEQSPALLDNSDLSGVRQQLKDLKAGTSIKVPGSQAGAASAGTAATATGGTSGSSTSTDTTNVADIPDAPGGGAKVIDSEYLAPAGQNLVTEPDGTTTVVASGTPADSTATGSGEQVLTATWGDAGDGTPTDTVSVVVTEDNTLSAVAPTPLADTESSLPDPEPEMPEAKNEYERGLFAYQEGNYAAAIRHYQLSLANENSENPQTYYDLSRAYYAIGQWQQAELYASEAMRRQPRNLQYRAQYLRTVQKSQSRQRLMIELAKAYEQFPDSPDIALALARGYDKIEQNPRNARIMYETFLQLAPADHAKRAEIEQLLITYP